MSPPNMSSAINESEIPTLSLLYRTNKLTPSSRPIFPPSTIINAKIGVIRTNITNLHLPNGAIVNAANETLTAGGGVCGAIHSAAGRELAEECRVRRGCETGHAKMTRAYKLPCKSVIHAVGPIYWLTKPLNTNAVLLESCYTEVLKLCVETGLTSVAFCALSTGVYGYPSYEAAESALKAVRRFLETENGKKMEFIIFCNFEKKDQDAYHDLIPIYFPPSRLDKEPVETTETTETAETTEPAKAEPQPEPTKSVLPYQTAKSVLPDQTAKSDLPDQTAKEAKDAEPATKLVKSVDGASNAKSEPAGPVPSKPKATPKKKLAPAENPNPVDDEADDFVLIDMEDMEFKSKK